MSEDEANKIIKLLNFRHEEDTVIGILQHFKTKQVLMVGNMNKEAVFKTLTSGYAHFWSLSRKKLWLKGETSGHFQIVEDLFIDCDEDALVFLVNPLGPTCHTGNQSCFYRNYIEFIKYNPKQSQEKTE
ncbi:phosphoribosyl-AMP cyclohydrolase [Acidianus manzaensis]|uniref:Phosphoribosyl-AMP cyclohydrolase n=1 Tax=Acidianus manzaensis TaxID=282676 RepID=A0A1W6K3T1_9CREN|nr:phosphoribosyl-AMP cyclohydrolase [Acidianus manzaensis]ARM77145.1 phosphoribosyl-AMP cyclohydrolase [Acidianus manzaensis]